MNKTRILKAIDQNEESYETRHDDAYHMSDDEGIQLARGTYLYVSSSIIKHIQRDLQRNIKDYKDAYEISEEDVFSYLKSQKIFKKDYDELSEQINEVIGEADYGQRSFYGEKKDFEELRVQLKGLYQEYLSFSGLHERNDDK